VEFYGIQSFNQVLDQRLTKPEEEEVVEHKTAFLKALKELETAKKYMY
jgi:hypothetical protein